MLIAGCMHIFSPLGEGAAAVSIVAWLGLPFCFSPPVLLLR